MSKAYLSGITDVEGLFKKSVDICSELSSQINCLANKLRDLSRDEIENLLDIENHSTRTFHQMESQWKHIVRKARSREDTVVFPKLNNKIQKARLIIQQTHTSYQTYQPIRNPPNIATPSGPTVFHVKGIFTKIQTGERVTTRTNFGGEFNDNKQDYLRRQTKNVVK